MDYRQYRRVRRLVHECCNYIDGNCIALDDGEECVCVQSISYSLLCRWFRAAVLPQDKELETALFHRMNVDTGIRIESAADLCCKCLDDVAMDVLYMTGNDHALEKADPLELAEIKRRWEPYINQLPDYAYLCKDLLNGKM